LSHQLDRRQAAKALRQNGLGMTPGNLLHVPDVNGLSGAHAACSRKVSLPSEPGPPMTLDGAAAGKPTVARKSAEMPDAHGAFGLQMPRASSTIPTPAITISEAAPAPAQKPAAQSSV
jgi:hypothetical protein